VYIIIITPAITFIVEMQRFKNISLPKIKNVVSDTADMLQFSLATYLVY
jgi:hypothetical protein